MASYLVSDSKICNESKNVKISVCIHMQVEYNFCVDNPQAKFLRFGCAFFFSRPISHMTCSVAGGNTNTHVLLPLNHIDDRIYLSERITGG